MGTVTIGGHRYRCPLAAGDRQGHCSWCGRTLSGRRTRWCSDEHARAFMDNHAWTNARRAALERDGFRCVRCQSIHQLQVHHVTEVDVASGYETGCQHHLDGLETLCAGCHRQEHDWRREVARVVEWAERQAPARQLVLPGVRV